MKVYVLLSYELDESTWPLGVFYSFEKALEVARLNALESMTSEEWEKTIVVSPHCQHGSTFDYYRIHSITDPDDILYYIKQFDMQ